MRNGFAFAVAALFAVPAHAEGPARAFLDHIDRGDAMVLQVLNGYDGAFSWANAQLHTKKQQRLYCQPMTRAHEPKEVVEILRAFIKAHPGKADAPAPVALLLALEEKYPCADAS